MRVALLFDNFGPYHWARLKAATQHAVVLAVEFHRRSRVYSWHPADPFADLQRVTLDLPHPQNADGRMPQFWVHKLFVALSQFSPDVVFLPGWSHPLSLAACAWCRACHVPAVLMSESTEHDGVRVPWKELLKRGFIRLSSAGLVGGIAHQRYLATLGMPVLQIFPGYDAVDNDYFSRRAFENRARAHSARIHHRLPKHFFLASARFISQKNLPFLLRAFSEYQKAASGRAKIDQLELEPWSLVVLGDGPQRELLERLVSELGLGGSVLLPGFKQYHELPAYYGLASAFIHVSISEPWGLVVNEAMASGLPVLVSTACGCADDLVVNGENGFLFNPTDLPQLVSLMLRLSGSPEQLARMGQAGSERISNWGPNRFAGGMLSAARAALSSRRNSPQANNCRGLSREFLP